VRTYIWPCWAIIYAKKKQLYSARSHLTAISGSMAMSLLFFAMVLKINKKTKLNKNENENQVAAAVE
jgi:hypothetical protein